MDDYYNVTTLNGLLLPVWCKISDPMDRSMVIVTQHQAEAYNYISDGFSKTKHTMYHIFTVFF